MTPETEQAFAAWRPSLQGRLTPGAVYLMGLAFAAGEQHGYERGRREALGERIWMLDTLRTALIFIDKKASTYKFSPHGQSCSANNTEPGPCDCGYESIRAAISKAEAEVSTRTTSAQGQG